MKFIKTRLYKYAIIDDIKDPNISGENEITEVLNSSDSLVSEKYGSNNSSDEDYEHNEAEAIENSNSSEGEVTLDLNFTKEEQDNIISKEKMKKESKNINILYNKNHDYNLRQNNRNHPIEESKELHHTKINTPSKSSKNLCFVESKDTSTVDFYTRK